MSGDHDNYFGTPVGKYSPSDQDVRTEKKYENGEAKRQFDEISVIIFKMLEDAKNKSQKK